MGRIVQNLIYRLRADDSELKKGLKSGQRETKRFSVKSLAALGALAVGAVAAFKRISAAVSQSIKDYGRQIDAEQSLRAAVQSSGQSVRDVIPVYHALASEIQELTTVGDEAALEMIATATSMGVVEDQMEDTIKGAIGLSDAFGIGTQQAIRGVANALEGNFTTLQRYIPALRTTEDESEKLAIVQEAMANGFEVSTAKADSAFGALQQYDNAVGDLREQMGQTIAEGIEPFVRVLTGFVARTAEASSKAREFREVIEALRDGEDLTQAFGVEQLQQALAAAEDELADFERTQGTAARGGAAAADAAAERGAQIRENVETLRRELKKLQDRNKLEEELRRDSDADNLQRIEFENQFAALVSRRIELQSREREALADIDEQLELNFLTEEQAAQAREAFYKQAQRDAIEVADGFNELAAEVEASELNMAALDKMTRVAVGDQIQRVIAGFTDKIRGVGEEAEESAEKQIAAGRSIYPPLIEDRAAFFAEGQRLLDEQAEREAQHRKLQIDAAIQTTQQTLGLFQNYFAALDALNRANANERLREIDRQLQRTLEANGLAEETTRERLDRELAVATANGDQEEIERLERVIRRNEFEEEAARERAQVEYETALESWRLQKLSTLSQVAQAVLNAYSSAAAIPLIGWLLAPAAALAAAAIGRVQLQAVTAAKPTAPTFATGGAYTIPPGYPMDSYPLPGAMVQSGERVTVETAEQQALNRDGGRPMRIMVALDGRTIASTTVDYINDGSVRLEAVR